MKFIKSYKIFESVDSKLQMHLGNYKIYDYIINEDGSIDVNKEVHLFNKNLISIPFKFNRVCDYFNIANNKLTSLKNCPKYIEGNFSCSHNKLISLEFGPEYVGLDYNCSINQLITLKGCVDEVSGSFYCQSNLLTSLEFCPMQVEGNFNCSYNKLEYLDRSPMIKGELYCKKMFKKEPEFNGSCNELYWI